MKQYRIQDGRHIYTTICIDCKNQITQTVPEAVHVKRDFDGVTDRYAIRHGWNRDILGGWRCPKCRRILNRNTKWGLILGGVALAVVAVGVAIMELL